MVTLMMENQFIDIIIEKKTDEIYVPISRIPPLLYLSDRS